MSTRVSIDMSLYIEDDELEEAVINFLGELYGVSKEEVLMDCESYYSHRKSAAEAGEDTDDLEDARVAFGWYAQEGDSVGEMGSPVWRDLENHCTSDEYFDWVVYSGDCDDPDDTQGFLSYLIEQYLNL